MSKHTPGPWFAGKPCWRRGGPPYKIPIHNEKGVVANVLTHESIEWYPPEKCDPQPNSDAKLIAAAPDMLAALKKIAEYKCEWRDKSGIWLQEVAAKAIEQLEHADKTNSGEMK